MTLPLTHPARRRFVTALAAFAVAVALPAVHAQARSGPLRLVVGFAPGGSIDRIARAIAPELARVTGRGVVVENVAGANSARAIARVAASDPNGDTLLVGSSALAHPDNAAGAAMLRPIMLVSTTPMVLVVRSTMPVHDPMEFAKYLKANAGATYGSSGVGNATHLCAAQLAEALGIDAVHVPYSGSSPVFADLVAGRIDFIMTGASSSLGQHASVRALAVTTRTRSKLPGLETLPTIAETLVPGFDFSLWQAVYAPVRTPDATAGEVLAQFREVLARPAVREALVEMGVETLAGSPDAADQQLRAEAKRFRERATP
jgi:tripartite-type tricarboxylate transporter receptor subunit TctC